MIIHAYISHYKSISEASLSLRPINVIVGPNGSGKSNLLDAIYFLHDCASEDIDTAVTRRHGIDSIRQWSRTKPYNIILEMVMKNEAGTGNYRVTISSTKGQYRIIEEGGKWVGPHPRNRYSSDAAKQVHSSSFHRSESGELTFISDITDSNIDRFTKVDPTQLFLTQIASRTALFSLTAFRPIADELTSFSKYNIYPNTLRLPQVVSREATLTEDGSNLASVLKNINSNRRFAIIKDDILSAIQSILPSITDFQVRSAGGYYVPVMRVTEANGDSHDFNLSQISDGTLRTLGLLAAFYQPNAPSKVGVEEPEQMIHPGALSVLYEAIRSFADSRKSRQPRQVFVTTHSPTLIDYFEPEDIIWTRYGDAATKCGHVKKRQLDIIKQQLFTAGELLIAEGLQ